MDCRKGPRRTQFGRSGQVSGYGIPECEQAGLQIMLQPDKLNGVKDSIDDGAIDTRAALKTVVVGHTATHRSSATGTQSSMRFQSGGTPLQSDAGGRILARARCRNKTHSVGPAKHRSKPSIVRQCAQSGDLGEIVVTGIRASPQKFFSQTRHGPANVMRGIVDASRPKESQVARAPIWEVAPAITGVSIDRWAVKANHHGVAD